MIIDCISDLHGFYPTLEGGDLLIVAGDITARDRLKEWADFFRWLTAQPYEKKILIAGNHDGFCNSFPKTQKEADDLKEVVEFLDEEKADFEYLCDTGTEFGGLKIWGSPYTPTFGNWHFMRNRGEAIKKHWDLIPADTDILVTHGPPFGVLDKTIDGKYAGCEMLRNAMFRVKPKLHIFGHIHEQGGKTIDLTSTICVNACIMNEHYRPVNKPIRITL